MELPEIKYELGDYADILKKDQRFDTRAYDFVVQVVHRASEDAKGHVSGHELLEYFRDMALDAYGPLAYDVLTDWGLTCCEDVGAVVLTLCEAGALGKREGDSEADFIGGYDFKTEFLDPFAI